MNSSSYFLILSFYREFCVLLIKPPQSALPKFEQARQIYQELNEQQYEAYCLDWLGGISNSLEDEQKALVYYLQALRLYRAVDDKAGETRTIDNIGSEYDGILFNERGTSVNISTLESIQAASAKFEQGRRLYQEINSKKDEARCLFWLGSINGSPDGDKQKAIDYYSQALPLYRAVNDGVNEAYMLKCIGAVYSDLGDKQQALNFYNEALPLDRALGDRGEEAKTLYSIGAIYSDLCDRQQALRYYNESLLLYRAVIDKDGEAATLCKIGLVYSALGDKQYALKYLYESIPPSRMTHYGDKNLEAETLDNLFSILVLDNPRFGVFYGKQSVNIHQLQRSNRHEFGKRHGKDLRMALSKSMENTYIRLADALSKQKRLAEARQVLDFSRSEQFAPLAFTVREAELTAAFNQKLETLVAAIRALDEYKRGIGERAPTADEAVQLQSLADEQTAANDDYLAFLKTAEQQFAAPLDDKDKTPVINDLTQM